MPTELSELSRLPYFISTDILSIGFVFLRHSSDNRITTLHCVGSIGFFDHTDCIGQGDVPTQVRDVHSAQSGFLYVVERVVECVVELDEGHLDFSDYLSGLS